MTTREAKKELKNHCIAIAAIMADLKKKFPKVDKISCNIIATSDAYGHIDVTTDKGDEFTSVVNMYNLNMLNEKWNENAEFSGTYGKENVG